jgi:hypothetical protein
MTSRPASSSTAAATAARGGRGATPHRSAVHRRPPSTATVTAAGAPTPRLPPHAPKPSRRPVFLPTDHPAAAQAQSTNPVFALAPTTLVPRASCGKPDDILAPPDAQSCPFAKAGLKVVGIGNGVYGELEGWLEWPAEVYAEERILPLPPR